MTSTSIDLLKALTQAAGRPMTLAEIFEQSVSWAYGQLPSESTMTKEQVRGILASHLGGYPVFDAIRLGKLEEENKRLLAEVQRLNCDGMNRIDRARELQARAAMAAQEVFGDPRTRVTFP